MHNISFIDLFMAICFSSDPSSGLTQSLMRYIIFLILKIHYVVCTMCVYQVTFYKLVHTMHIQSCYILACYGGSHHHHEERQHHRPKQATIRSHPHCLVFLYGGTISPRGEGTLLVSAGICTLTGPPDPTVQPNMPNIYGRYRLRWSSG